MLLGKCWIKERPRIGVHLWVITGHRSIPGRGTKIGVDFVELDLDIAEIFFKEPHFRLDTYYENV